MNPPPPHKKNPVYGTGVNTDQLDGGQMLLPPEVLLILRSHRGHHVVEVHDHVDHIIHQVRKCSVAA